MVVNCEQVWSEISNYIEGEVDAGLRAAMDEHFQTCQRCKSVLEGTRNVVQLYGDERMLELPAGFSRRLERKLAQPAAGAGRGWSTWSAWLVPVAALVLIAGGLEVASSGVVNRPLESELQSQHAQPGRDIPPDMIVVVSAGAKLFHVAGCEFIHNKDKERTLTAKEAMREGYVPCTRCLRKYLSTAVSGFPGSVWQAGADFDEEGVAGRNEGD
jgi:hypothetical protein